MKKIKKIISLSVLGSVLPLVTLADTQSINGILDNFKGTLNKVVVVIFALATVVFGWGVVQYISAGGDEEKIKVGKQHMIWGVIGMAVMFGVWGLVKILAGYFGITSGGSITPPQI